MNDEALASRDATTEGRIEQVSILSAQAAVPRYPGDKNKGWNDLQDAFEAGTVRTSVGSKPPFVASELLDREDVATPNWWKVFSRSKPSSIPLVWSDWFLSGGIVVDVADLRAHVESKMEEERGFFRGRRRRGLAPSTWTDLEAWAWIASRDGALTEAVGDFVRVEFQNPNNPEYARQMAVEYLQFRVREDFCKCGAELALVEPDKCQCSHSSWLRLVEALRNGRLVATATNDRGMQEAVPPEAFRGAIYNPRIRKFLLTGVERESLFDRLEVERLFAPKESGESPPPNRRLDHAMVKGRAADMRAEQPSISKGSAAASIIAEMGPNPRTGKPWDNRHIERIIAPLWEGGLLESPR